MKQNSSSLGACAQTADEHQPTNQTRDEQQTQQEQQTQTAASVSACNNPSLGGFTRAATTAASGESRAFLIGSFVILYLGYMILFADRSVFNISLAAIGQEFSVSPAALGAAGSAFFLGYTIMQIPGGWLTDTFSSRRIIIVTLIIWSVLTCLTGCVWSIAALLVVRFLFGLAEGPYPAAAMTHIAKEFPEDKRSQLTSALISSNYAGAAVAPFIIVPIIALMGWRAGFFWLGIFGVILAIVYVFFKSKHALSSAPSKRARINWRDINPRVWTFIVIGVALNCITKGLETWMPIYFLNEKHIELIKLAVLVPLPVIAGGIAALISGFVMVHVFKNHERLLIVIASFLTVVTMTGLYLSTDMAWIIGFQVATYFVKSLAFTGIFAYVASRLPGSSYGSHIGVINFGGQLGGFVGPLFIGCIIQFTNSYTSAFFGLVCAALLAGIVSLFIRSSKTNI